MSQNKMEILEEQLQWHVFKLFRPFGKHKKRVVSHESKYNLPLKLSENKWFYSTEETRFEMFSDALIEHVTNQHSVSVKLHSVVGPPAEWPRSARIHHSG